MTENGGPGGPIEHGFPHLATVRASITALFRRLSADGIRAYDTSITPADAAFDATDDLYPGAQRVAAATVRALRLPDARMVVSFRAMEEAATVELATGPEYFVEVNDRFRTHRRDLAAALSHEVAHVLLHRLDLHFPGTAENEILTDTAAAYLGAGWLLLDAYREDALTHQRFGYLTPEEFGYVLAKRAALFDEDPAPWFTSHRAYEAYVRGRALAERDHRRAPLAAAGPLARRRYAKAQRTGGDGGAGNGGAAGAAGGDASTYRFEQDGSGGGLRVSFPCPVCAQRLRVPVRGRLRARCGLCHSVLDCLT
ncbi:hypothetical protein [Streptomyces avidinii]|uniref:Uncharacterized protein n=1 Tax=Streptomyces avidinii TaxID=1895 RepID=A0ABS4L3H1_STRAV|nr:hypothetical protein [Streptomyces avidinii]MBP2036647.1 hypothetical protein [Streptomyces avidinii]GGY80070.1 hypothetical protein GCM10010343_00680 [Streptomyces avidinii]